MACAYVDNMFVWVGQNVQFGYNGKDRTGVVEKIVQTKNLAQLLVCKTESGYRSFNTAKIHKLSNGVCKLRAWWNR